MQAVSRRCRGQAKWSVSAHEYAPRADDGTGGKFAYLLLVPGNGGRS